MICSSLNRLFLISASFRRSPIQTEGASGGNAEPAGGDSSGSVTDCAELRALVAQVNVGTSTSCPHLCSEMPHLARTKGLLPGQPPHPMGQIGK